jgi:hypothetical protein
MQHALRCVSDLIAVSHVREQRRGDDPEDFISSVAFAGAKAAAGIPELAENDDVHVIDVVDGGLLAVGTLQEGHRLQLGRQASAVLNQGADGVVLTRRSLLEGGTRIEPREETLKVPRKRLNGQNYITFVRGFPGRGSEVGL